MFLPSLFWHSGRRIYAQFCPKVWNVRVFTSIKHYTDQRCGQCFMESFITISYACVCVYICLYALCLLNKPFTNTFTHAVVNNMNMFLKAFNRLHRSPFAFVLHVSMELVKCLDRFVDSITVSIKVFFWNPSVCFFLVVEMNGVPCGSCQTSKDFKLRCVLLYYKTKSNWFSLEQKEKVRLEGTTEQKNNTIIIIHQNSSFEKQTLNFFQLATSFNRTKKARL